MSRALGKPRYPGYRSGSHWANCWSCGFAFRQEELKETWDNRWVCSTDWEARHEQDFLRVHPEKIAVDEPILLDDTTNLISGATFGHTSAVSGEGEAGRAIAGKKSDIPVSTFRHETNPSVQR